MQLGLGLAEQGKGWLTWMRREKLSSECGDTGWQRTCVPVPDHEPVPPSPCRPLRAPVHTRPPALNPVCLKWRKGEKNMSIKGLMSIKRSSCAPGSGAQWVSCHSSSTPASELGWKGERWECGIVPVLLSTALSDCGLVTSQGCAPL